jgi:type IV pilus assembly protein PilV
MAVAQTFCLPAPAQRGRRGQPRQRGMMLIEALIALLIFSIGILGIIGLQASAVQQSTDAKNRAEAAYLADQLMGRMWVDNRSVGNLQAKYQSCGSSCPGFWAWYGSVKATLPGVADSIADTQPQVSVDDTGIVTISVFWRATSDDASTAPHRYDLQAQIAQ